MSPGDLFHDEMLESPGAGVSDWCYQIKCSPDGESYRPPPSGDALGIVLLYCDDHRNGQQSVYIMLHHRFDDCFPGGRLGNTEQVVTRWRRLVASSEALGAMHRHISPAHHHGHRNGPRRRSICSPPQPISIAVIVAKEHLMVH
jgi:hypothetical protein